MLEKQGAGLTKSSLDPSQTGLRNGVRGDDSRVQGNNLVQAVQ